MKFRIDYDSEYCGTDFCDIVEAESLDKAMTHVDREWYRDEFDLDEDDEVYINVEPYIETFDDEVEWDEDGLMELDDFKDE